jgi:hypothetical protein
VLAQYELRKCNPGVAYVFAGEMCIGMIDANRGDVTRIGMNYEIFEKMIEHANDYLAYVRFEKAVRPARPDR